MPLRPTPCQVRSRSSPAAVIATSLSAARQDRTQRGARSPPPAQGVTADPHLPAADSGSRCWTPPGRWTPQPGAMTPAAAARCWRRWRSGDCGSARRWICAGATSASAPSASAVASKTDAGIRDVALSPALLEALTEYRTRSAFTEPEDYVFATAKGKRDSDTNVSVAASSLRRSLRPTSSYAPKGRTRSARSPRTRCAGPSSACWPSSTSTCAESWPKSATTTRR